MQPEGTRNEVGRTPKITTFTNQRLHPSSPPVVSTHRLHPSSLRLVLNLFDMSETCPLAVDIDFGNLTLLKATCRDWAIKKIFEFKTV